MGIDVLTLSKSKKYTNMVALGLSSAVVDDTAKTITFTLAADGSQHTIHFDQPKDGVSITNISVDANNNLVCAMSDGTEQKAKIDLLDNVYTKTETDTLLLDKAEKNHNHDSAYASKDTEHEHSNKETLDKFGVNDGGKLTFNGDVVTPEAMDLGDYLKKTDAQNTYVAKETGKGLSENDFTTVLKDAYDKAVEDSHTHTNKSVIDKFSEGSDGKLLYDGQSIEADLSDVYKKTETYSKTESDEKFVEKVDGKGLSTNDYTTEEKEKLAGLENYNDAQIKTQIQAVANGLMDSVGYSADYKTIDIIAKNGVKKSVNVAPIISHASITELSDVDTTNKATGKALVYNAITSKHEYADVSGTDEKVKMDASTDAKYLGELLDNITIANENGELKVKKLDGQEVTITEINYLKGLTMNVMDLVNMFSNGGVKIINTPVATYAELLTLDKSSFIEGISYLVYVLADENHDNAKTTYLVDKDSETPTYFGFADSQRDFTTNPIDLATEITGKLGIANMDSDAIKALFTVDDTYKTETATNNAFSTHGAKALYDELLLAIGNKANDSDLTTHKNDANIHVSTTEKNSWNGKADASELTAHTDNTDIHVTTDDKTAWNKVTDKVDKIEGKGLSTNDYTNEEKALVATIGDKVDKSSIATALDDTVTDEQVASALLAKTELDKISTAQQEAVTKVNESLAYNASKNMLYANVGTINGVTITSKDKSTALLNGTNTSNVSVFETADVIPSGEYHIKVSNRVGALYVWDLTHSKTIIEVDNTECNFTLTEPSKLVVGFSIGSGHSFTNFEVSGQLEKGTVATDFVPYNGKSNLELTNDVVSLKNDLNTLEYSEIAGGKNLFNGNFIEEVLEAGKNYTDVKLIKEQNSIKDIKGITFAVFGAYLKKGTYTFSYTNDAYFSLNRVAIAGTDCVLAIESIRKSYTWTQNTDGWTYFGIEGDDSETGVTDTPFSVTPDIQIEEGTQATAYEPYISSVKMLADEVSAQNKSLSDLENAINGLNDDNYWEQGTWNILGQKVDEPTIIRMKEKLILPIDYSVSLVNSNYVYEVDYYENGAYKNDTDWISGSIVIPNGQEFVLLIRKVDNSSLVPTERNAISVLPKNIGTINDKLKNDLAPKKIELQNVDERVTIQDNGSFIINGFAFVNLLVTFNETLPQWSNFVRLPRPKGGNVSVYCENSVKLTIYSQDNLPGDCGTYENVSSGTEIRLLVNYEVA